MNHLYTCLHNNIIIIIIIMNACSTLLFLLFEHQQGRRNTTFGVDFQEQVERYKSQVPPIMTKCLAEIERRGVMIRVRKLSFPV